MCFHGIRIEEHGLVRYKGGIHPSGTRSFVRRFAAEIDAVYV